MKKIALIFALLFILPTAIFATSGCLYTSGYIYIVAGGSGAPSVPNFTYSGQASQRITASSYCVVTMGGANSCYINYSGGSAYGTLVDYSSLPCAAPIDNEVYILMIGAVGFTFYTLRNKLLVS